MYDPRKYLRTAVVFPRSRSAGATKANLFLLRRVKRARRDKGHFVGRGRVGAGIGNSTLYVTWTGFNSNLRRPEWNNAIPGRPW